jgi:hypothetical protein
LLIQHEEELEKSQIYEELQVFGTDRSSADSREPLLRWSLATGHAADILDEYDPNVGYDPETFP